MFASGCSLREHEQHRVLEQEVALDAVLLREARAEAEHEVELAALELRLGRLGLAEAHRQLDRGVLGAEVRDRERHQRRAGGLEGGHPQAPAAQAGDRLELGLRLGEAREHGVGVAHERLARLGEAHAARAALHEDRAGLALERGDLLRDGGLREGEGLRGGGEGTLDGDLAEDAHAADVEHELSL